MFAIIGKIANAAIGWALPGAGPSVLYIVAGLMAVGIPSAYAWHKGAEGKAAAIATERAACELGKAHDAEQSALAVSTLMDEIARLSASREDDGKTGAELCKGSKFCRDGGKK